MNTEVDIRDGFATVRPPTAEIAAALLDQAGRDGVQTVTGRKGLAFRVAEEHAVAAGVVHGGKGGAGDGADAPADGSETPTEGNSDGNVPEPVEEPSRAASTDTWRDFLTEQGIEVPAEATRADMIDAWDNR